MVTQIDGIDVTPRVGSYIKPKHWPLGSLLAAGDSFKPIPAADQFRWADNLTGCSGRGFWPQARARRGPRERVDGRG